MPRMLVISWKNKRSGFTRRYRWFAESSQNIGENIRINLEDMTEGAVNHYPKSREEAERLVKDFKEGKINVWGKEIDRESLGSL